MTELEKLRAGLEYHFDDPEVAALKQNAINQCAAYAAIDSRDSAARRVQLEAMLGKIGERVWIADTFNCDNGKNITIGDNFTGNFNLTILDIREVTIGDNVMIGPNTMITTVGHPLSPMARRQNAAIAKPVSIGNDVWIGGNVTVLPGVSIGNNVVVGAGAVVTHDVPDNCVVAGVPARKIRDIVDDTK
ncbi:sugar O-acetyltransferase [Paratractidigestivibacter sp.]|uniref:sugar O-acetyltransferase n=1 Tax=Paratractidigestivibacter sp. TaxID=2847316 RepID=UPI002ABD1CDD|nr:sugar O-acetyltransferase [Paratractidigestivibacter sp.]